MSNETKSRTIEPDRNAIAEHVAGERRRYAETILVHYARNASRGPWAWDPDNAAELESAVEAIIEAATLPLLARIEALEADVAALATLSEPCSACDGEAPCVKCHRTGRIPTDAGRAILKLLRPYLQPKP